MNHLSRIYIEVQMLNDGAAHKFIQALQKENIFIKNLHFHDSYIRFLVNKKDLKILRRIRKKYSVKFTLKRYQPYALIPADFISVFSILLLIVIPLILNSFIWTITYEQTTPELEDSISKILYNEFQLKRGIHNKQLPQSYEIRQQILSNHPEISWVFIERFGTKLNIKVQYAPKVEEKLKPPIGSHLVAKNSGIITHWDIQSGDRLFTKNMTVLKGDLLVSGIVKFQDKDYKVGAQGKVFVDYWLEMDFSIPTKVEMTQMEFTGWKLYGFNVPKRLNKTNLNKIVQLEKVISEKKTIIKITEENMESYISPILQQKILDKMDSDTTIKSQKILQANVVGDTVKGKILFLINENIAQYQPF